MYPFFHVPGQQYLLVLSNVYRWMWHFPLSHFRNYPNSPSTTLATCHSEGKIAERLFIPCYFHNYKSNHFSLRDSQWHVSRCYSAMIQRSVFLYLTVVRTSLSVSFSNSSLMTDKISIRAECYRSMRSLRVTVYCIQVPVTTTKNAMKIIATIHFFLFSAFEVDVWN